MENQELLELREKVRVNAAEHARALASEKARADAAEARAEAEKARADAADARADAAERNMESNFKLFVESHNNEFKQPQRKCNFFTVILKRLKNVLLFS
jgi:uncharacterized protein involved in exopolysaccharide biosynthesis